MIFIWIAAGVYIAWTVTWNAWYVYDGWRDQRRKTRQLRRAIDSGRFDDMLRDGTFDIERAIAAVNEHPLDFA